jgi:hypothetical protein
MKNKMFSEKRMLFKGAERPEPFDAGEGIEAAEGNLSSAWENLSEAGGDIGDAIGNSYDGAKNSVSRWFSKTGNKWAGRLAKVGGNASDAMVRLGRWEQSQIGSLERGVYKTAGNAAKGVEDSQNRVMSDVNGLIESGEEAYDTTVTELASLKDWAVEKGENIKDGTVAEFALLKEDFSSWLSSRSERRQKVIDQMRAEKTAKAGKAPEENEKPA